MPLYAWQLTQGRYFRDVHQLLPSFPTALDLPPAGLTFRVDQPAPFFPGVRGLASAPEGGRARPTWSMRQTGEKECRRAPAAGL